MTTPPAPPVPSTAEAGRAQSESVARAVPQLQKLSEPPTDAVIEILQAEASVQQIDDATRQELSRRFAELDMTINPRYGTFDPAQSSVVVSRPDWIAPATPEG